MEVVYNLLFVILIIENMNFFFAFLHKRCRVFEAIDNTEIQDEIDKLAFSCNGDAVAGEYVHERTCFFFL